MQDECEVLVYTTTTCPYCVQAEQYLRTLGFSRLRSVLVDGDAAAMAEMIAKTNRRTVPQIFMNDVHIGGYSDLLAAHKSGQLDSFLT